MAKLIDKPYGSGTAEIGYGPAAAGLTVTGTEGDDALSGGGDKDTLYGLGGNDTLDGGAGGDLLVGGPGNDSYVVDASNVDAAGNYADSGDVVVELTGEGTDTIFSSVSYRMPAAVEVLSLTGTAAVNAYAGDGTPGATATLNGNDAANTLQGGNLDDSLNGNGGNDVLLGDVGSDHLDGGAGDDSLSGGGDSDVLLGGAGNDKLDGGAGADAMAGGAGDDSYWVDDSGDSVSENSGEGTDTVLSAISYTLGANVENLTLVGAEDLGGSGNTGNNLLVGNEGDNALNGGGGDDQLYGGNGNDTLVGGAGNDVLDGGAGADTLAGGAGNDSYYANTEADTVSENAGAGTDTVFSAAAFYALPANVENLTLQAGAIGGDGNSGDNRLIGNSDVNFLSGGAGNDWLDGGAGVDFLTGGTGDDTFIIDNPQDSVTENPGEGRDTVFSPASYSLAANAVNVENLTLTGTLPVDGVGDGGDNALTGNGANNVLSGGAGNDILYGGGGADKLLGGDGNDTYIIDQTSNTAGFTVSEAAGCGIDTVQSSIAYVLGANLENLALTGAAAVNGTGNSLNNQLSGNAAANRLDGGVGADAMDGGAGNDTYIVDDNATVAVVGGVTITGDVVSESAGAGTDSVLASVSYVLPANIENLTLTGTAYSAAGNSSANVITGNAAANRLDGGGGADSLAGGGGDDVYLVANLGVTVTEFAGQGTDQVQSAVSFTLPDNVENLSLTGAAASNGTGNAASNAITGNSGGNLLDGKLGADMLIGQAGDDTYVVDDNSGKFVWQSATYTGDQVVEIASQGTDLVKSSLAYTLVANVANLVLTGSLAITGAVNALGNVLVGNAAANQLDGGGGADWMLGGAGNDTYIVDNNSQVAVLTGTAADGSAMAATLTGDTVVENSASGGVDWVLASVSYSLPGNVENLTLTGAAAINGAGNAAANYLIGNAAANLLDGKGGADTLVGGGGDDTYVIDNSGVSLSEAAGGGTDTVLSSVSYALGTVPAIENLTLAGSAANATGNALNNLINGNAAANWLDGGLGADWLLGGGGNDTYVVDNNNTVAVLAGAALIATLTGDTVSETASGGVDTVQASVSYSLPANVENLALTGSLAINATGNALANVLTGNDGNNLLDGGAGADSMAGGQGNDTYVVDNSADTVTETASGGLDTVQSAISYSLAATHVENLVLLGTANLNATGNALNNILTGNGGDNLLDGGAGADSLAGGGGNDTYVIDNAADSVTEAAGGGSDLVQSALSHTLAANVENLSLAAGAGNLNGTGNGLDNVLLGNEGSNTLLGLGGNDLLSGGAGNDWLDGGAGADSMVGGQGNDTFIVDDNSQVALVGGVAITGDTILENLAGGIDLVQSSVSYSLGANLENLTLTGAANANASGNELNNTLTGNSGGNWLDGGAGADLMLGGLGSDTYVVDNPGDVVSEQGGGGTDGVLSAVSYSLATAAASNVENLTLTGALAVNATGNDLANTLTGNSGDNVLDGRAGADWMAGGGGNDTYLVDNNSTVAAVGGVAYTGDTISETASGGVDEVRSAVSYSLPPNVENLVLLGAGALNGAGNAGGNRLLGTAGKNLLDGGGGNDSLAGGGGVDKLAGGAGDDTFVYTDSTDTGYGLGYRDLIADFTPSESVGGTLVKHDQIDLSGLDADPATSAIEHWTFVTAFTAQGRGEVKFTAATASAPALVELDYSDGNADLQIELAQVGATPLALSAADFIL